MKIRHGQKNKKQLLQSVDEKQPITTNKLHQSVLIRGA